MNENKIHIAVIGAGTVARDNQIPAFLKCSEAEVTAVFDRHIERAEALAGSYGIPKAYCRLEDVLADKDIDCVSICTGNVSHESLVLAAAEAGKEPYSAKSRWRYPLSRQRICAEPLKKTT